MANEKRLIDANAYKASLTKWKEDAWKHNERHDAMLIADCLCELETMPTVDAVEVVRCKDCDNTCPGSNGLVCTAWGARTDPDGWCYKAERKGNG